KNRCLEPFCLLYVQFELQQTRPHDVADLGTGRAIARQCPVEQHRDVGSSGLCHRRHVSVPGIKMTESTHEPCLCCKEALTFPSQTLQISLHRTWKAMTQQGVVPQRRIAQSGKVGDGGGAA